VKGFMYVVSFESRYVFSTNVVVLGFADFHLTVEPQDTVVVTDEPLMLDCAASYTDDTGTRAASIQWLRDSQPFAFSPPRKYDNQTFSILHKS